MDAPFTASSLSSEAARAGEHDSGSTICSEILLTLVEHRQSSRAVTADELRQDPPWHQPLLDRRLRLTLLAVLLVRIHVPDVEDRLLRRVPDGEDGRHHGVVLIIAGVQAGTAGRIDVEEGGVQPVLYRFAVLVVIAIVNGVGIRDADDTTVDDIRAPGDADLAQFTRRQADELLIVHPPEAIPLVAEVLHSKASLGRIGHHVTAPVLVVLDASDMHARVVNVNPVVRE